MGQVRSLGRALREEVVFHLGSLCSPGVIVGEQVVEGARVDVLRIVIKCRGQPTALQSSST